MKRSFTQATKTNLNKYDVVNLPYGDCPVPKDAIVLSVQGENVTVYKLYESKNMMQTYKTKSLRKLVNGSVFDLPKFIHAVQIN